MSPSDILELIGSELNFRERSVLHELVVQQLQEEVQKKSDDLLKKMIEASKSQAEVERLTMRIKCLESTSSEKEEEQVVKRVTR